MYFWCSFQNCVLKCPRHLVVNSLLISFLWSQRLSLLLCVWCTTIWLGCLGEKAVVGIRQYLTCTFPCFFCRDLSPRKFLSAFTVDAFCIYAYELLFAAALLHWWTLRTAVLGQTKNAAQAASPPCRPCLGRNTFSNNAIIIPWVLP